MQRYKLYYLWVIGVGLCTTPLVAQFKQLPVPLHGQKADQLCWAASIQMINEYHKPSSPLKQCDLALALYRLNHSGDVPAERESCVCNDECLQVCEDLNQTIDFYYGGDELEYPFFTLLFHKLGYRAFEDHVPLSWKAVQQEIDNCRPLILINSVSGGTSGDHVVVGKGYYLPSPNDPYIIINDPWEVCKGCTYLLNYEMLVSDQEQIQCNGLKIHQVRSMVHHIEPKEEGCESCKDNNKPITIPEEQSLVYKVEQNKRFFIGTRFGSTVDKVTFNNYLEETRNSHAITKVNYLSYNKLSRNIRPNVSIDDISVDGKFQEVTYLSDRANLIAEISEAGDCIVINRITDCMIYAEDPIVCTIGGVKVYLSNKTRIFPNENAVRYSLIKYNQYGVTYAKFNYKGKNYWYPLSGDKGKILKNPASGSDVFEERDAVKDVIDHTKKYQVERPFTVELKGLKKK